MYFTVSVQICLIIDGLYVILVMVSMCMLPLWCLRLSSTNKCLLTYLFKMPSDDSDRLTVRNVSRYIVRGDLIVVYNESAIVD